MSTRTPNYRTTEDWSPNGGGINHWGGSISGGDDKVLPEGSYVRPIQLSYVPKHVLEDPRWRNFDSNREVFVYSKIGIVAIPKRILRDE